MLTTRSLAVLLPLLLLSMGLSVLGVQRGVLAAAVEIAVVTTMIAGLVVVSERRRTRAIGLGLAIPAVVLYWAARLTLDVALFRWAELALAGFFGFLAVAITQYVLKRDETNAHLVMAAGCSYLLIGLCFSSLYAVIVSVRPDALSLGAVEATAEGMRLLHGKLVYFSITTLTTVGYGDITPQSEAARAAAMLEAVVGQLYVVIVLARVVGGRR